MLLRSFHQVNVSTWKKLARGLEKLERKIKWCKSSEEDVVILLHIPVELKLPPRFDIARSSFHCPGIRSIFPFAVATLTDWIFTWFFFSNATSAVFNQSIIQSLFAPIEVLFLFMIYFFFIPALPPFSLLRDLWMVSSLYEARLHGIMVVVFSKTCARLGSAEYNYHDTQQACLVRGNSSESDIPNMEKLVNA